MARPPKDLFLAARAVSVVSQRKRSTFCRSRLDEGRPLLDTGDSGIFGFESHWS